MKTIDINALSNVTGGVSDRHEVRRMTTTLKDGATDANKVLGVDLVKGGAVIKFNKRVTFDAGQSITVNNQPTRHHAE